MNNDDNLENMDGDFDMEAYRKQLQDMYERLTGDKLDDSLDEVNFSEFDGVLSYEKNLSEDLDKTNNLFRTYIDDENMDLDIEFYNESGVEFVDEIWCGDEDVEIKRTYIYDHDIIQTFDLCIQKEIYTKRLDYEVDRENFEEASVIRDYLNEIKEG